MKGIKGVSLLAAVLAIGLLVLGVAAPALAQGPWGGPGGFGWGPMMGGQGFGGMWDAARGTWGSMMGRWGGMMGGMMGGWRGGPFGGMMGGWGWTDGDTTPLSAEEAQRIAEEYVASYGNPDLEVAEIMEFDNQFYVQAREESTGRYAFEFLIDRYTGAAYPEPGPNMMWNTRYDHMGGFGSAMMGSTWNAPADDGTMPITPEEAIELAQEYLNAYAPGLEAADEADAFYGYYTIHTLKDGEVVGMLSVNGYTGSVWPHTWHGEYLGMAGGDDH
ncbi:MAG: hypothetical protein Q9O62_11930 [Ardenticatenia bacterium]|nr:hypothetical protein [Ardenticatenia bacterium]